MNLKEQMAATIGRYGMIEKGDLVLCALSGGGDSMAMTAVLAQLRPVLGFTLAAAHFTHGLRPQAAEAERELARAFCDERQIAFYSEKGDTRRFCEEHHLGLEEGARRLRYDFLARVAETIGAQKIATGHQREDHAETVMQNMMRGTGLAGLCGIPPVRGKIIRPMIEASEMQIGQYLAENHISYASDPSNDQPVCGRNRLRKTVFPRLREVYPEAEAKIFEMSDTLRGEADFIRAFAQRAFENAVSEKNGAIALDLKAWQKEHPAIRRRILRECCFRAGCGEKELSRRHIDALESLCGGQSGGRIDLPRHITAQKSFEFLFFAAKTEEKPIPTAVLEKNHAIFLAGWRFSLDEPPERDDTIIGFYWDQQTPIVIRARAEGDFIELGDHKKTLKKWMIEQRIPAPLRDQLPLICSGCRVLHVCGCPPFSRGKQEKTEHWIIVRRTE